MPVTLMDRASSISTDPMDRVPDGMKAVLESPDVTFDVHCHVFTLAIVTNRFFWIRFPIRRRFWKWLSHLAAHIFRHTSADQLTNIAYFVKIGSSEAAADIADKMFSYYPQDKTVFCPLMMDLKHGMGGEPEMDLDDQLRELAALTDRPPHRLLPFVAIDPRSEDAEENFLKAFQPPYNFFGVKIYPVLGYLPTHPTLLKIFEVCEKKRIPVTAHCGDAMIRAHGHHFKNVTGVTIDDEDEFESFGRDIWLWTRNSYCEFFGNPSNWEPVLRTFPRLKLNLAHFGTGEEWVHLLGGKNRTWTSRILDMMSRYEHLYADVSFDIAQPAMFEGLRDRIERNALLAERTLYGSDYYMIVSAGHFRSFKTDFANAMGDDVMRRIAEQNPQRFLFG